MINNPGWISKETDEENLYDKLIEVVRSINNLRAYKLKILQRIAELAVLRTAQNKENDRPR